MEELRLQIKNLSHSFNYKTVFENLELTVDKATPTAVSGGNGSGKSTLLKLMSGLLLPQKGEIEFYSGETIITNRERQRVVSMFAPYINLYDELTGEENLKFFLELCNTRKVKQRTQKLLEKVGLKSSSEKLFKNYSSGMKQRLRLAFALCNEPEVLLMDEPSTNLDEAGFEIVKNVMAEQIEKGLLVVASNDKRDLELCSQTIRIENFKT